MDEMLGSPVPYVIMSRLITNELNAAGKFHSRFFEINNPVWCGSWTLKDDTLTVLTAELEEGIDHTDKGYSAYDMAFPVAFDERCMVVNQWGTTRYVTNTNYMKYVLRKGESKLFRINKL